MKSFEQFKQEFREKALLRGEDPETREKISPFEAAHRLAQMRRDLHYSRLRQLVQAAADRQVASGKFPSEGRGFLKNDGTLDQTLVDHAMVKTWWRHISADDWKPGAGSSLVERRAFAAIRHDVEAAHPPAPRTTVTLEEMGEVLREVIEEDHAQNSQKPVEMSLYIEVV